MNAIKTLANRFRSEWPGTKPPRRLAATLSSGGLLQINGADLLMGGSGQNGLSGGEGDDVPLGGSGYDRISDGLGYTTTSARSTAPTPAPARWSTVTPSATGFGPWTS